METPKKYKELLKKNIITKEMLALSAYSVNKRAKNHRNNKRNYSKAQRRGWYDRYGWEDREEEKEQEMYKYKSILLSLVEPTCIHKEFGGYKTKRIYSYQKNYRKLYKKHGKNNNIVWENSYFDMERGEVWFFDFIIGTTYRYYKFYEIDGFSFHQPIDSLDESEGLQVKEINEIVTEGRNISDLLSMQFVKKVCNIIQSGEFMFQ